MKTFGKFLLCLGLFFPGCHGNNGVQKVYSQTYPQPGNPQTFDLIIDNQTQFPIIPSAIIFPGPTGLPVPAGQVLIIPPGSVLDFSVGFLPQSIEVGAQNTQTPAFIYSTQILNLGFDYSYFATSVTVTFH